MSTHYAMCKYDDATGSYIPLEVRPTTDTLKNDDPLYQEGFQAGAASRDAEIAELNQKLNQPVVLSEWQLLEKERDKLRAELAAALAACKEKDGALEYHRDVHVSNIKAYQLRDTALAIQPDDSALKAWLGKPVAWEYADAFGTHYTDDRRDWMDTPGIESVTSLYSPKELK